MSHAFDPISVIEAAYALDPEDADWLEELARRMSPVMDHSYGVVGGTYLLDGEHTRYGARVGVGVPQEVFQAGEADPSIGRMLETLFSLPGSFHRVSDATPELVENLRRAAPGVHDVVGLLARRTPREGMFVSAITPGPYEPTRSTRRLFDRIAAHLEAGHRLRASLPPGANDGGPAEAIFESDGRMVHARGPARTRSAQERLREAVRNVDRARGRLRSSRPSEAVELWPALVSARWSLVDQFESDGRRYVVAVSNPVPEGDPRALSERQGAIVHHIALGRSVDETAYALGVGVTTVRTHLQRAMRKLGVRSRAELTMLVSSPLQLEPSPDLPSLAFGGEEAALADPVAPLTEAERQVLVLLLRGVSNVDIARMRGVSYRTVANQVSSVLRKYGVCDRHELVATVRGAASPR